MLEEKFEGNIDYAVPEFDFLPKNGASQVEWNTEQQVQLWKGLAKYRPVGLHKHFRMLSLYTFFNKNSATKATIDQIWRFLGELYDLNYLDAMDVDNNSQVLITSALANQHDCLSSYPIELVKGAAAVPGIKSRKNSGSLQNSAVDLNTPAVVDFDLPVETYNEILLERRMLTDVEESEEELEGLPAAEKGDEAKEKVAEEVGAAAPSGGTKAKATKKQPKPSKTAKDSAATASAKSKKKKTPAADPQIALAKRKNFQKPNVYAQAASAFTEVSLSAASSAAPKPSWQKSRSQKGKSRGAALDEPENEAVDVSDNEEMEDVSAPGTPLAVRHSSRIRQSSIQTSQHPSKEASPTESIAANKRKKNAENEPKRRVANKSDGKKRGTRLPHLGGQGAGSVDSAEAAVSVSSSLDSDSEKASSTLGSEFENEHAVGEPELTDEEKDKVRKASAANVTSSNADDDLDSDADETTPINTRSSAKKTKSTPIARRTRASYNTQQ